MFQVGIDARMIHHSGIGTYIRSLLAEYEKVPSGVGFRLLGDSHELGQYKSFDVTEFALPIYGFREQLVLPRRIGKVNVFHAPHYNGPLFYRGKLVVTIHDIIHIRFPEYLPSRKAYLYARYMLKAVARKAVRVITSSQNTRADLVEELEIPYEKIKVIPFGVDERFQVIEDKSSLSGFREKYKLPESFILYAGNLKAHKNLAALLKAFKLLRREKKIQESLALTTGGSPVPKKLLEQVFNEGMEGLVKFLPFIPDDEMPLLYNCASVFAFPSLYEGFGLPPVEAMSCGVPVVASNSASLPEVLGDAAVMCDPRSVESFKDAMWDLLTNDSRRDDLRAKGMAQAKSFSWTETARKTIEVYKEAAAFTKSGDK